VSDSQADRIAELEKLLAQRDADLAKRDADLAKRDADLAKRDQRIDQLLQRMSLLEAHLRRSLRGRFIPSSETLIHDPGQLSLALSDLAELTFPLQPLAHVPEDTPGAGSPPRRRRGRRRSLAERYPDLEIDLQEEDLEAHEKFDADGTPLVRMGWEDSDTIVWGIAAPVIRRTRRYRYGRSDTGEKIAIAPVPPRVTPQGILADETIHSAVVGHVLDALPWHRQEVMSERAGCRIPRSVLANAFAAWCGLMKPLADEIRAYVLSQPVIGADSSFMPQQDGKKPLRCSSTGMWAITDGIAVAMQWTPDLRHARVTEVLGGYRGTLIRDEWEGFKDLMGAALDHPDGRPGTIDMGGCHAHARRRFTDLHRVDDRADRILHLYQMLYRCETEAVEECLDGGDLVEARERIRSQRSRPIWDRIVDHAQSIVDREAPSTAIFRAANYVVKYRRTLERFLADGRMAIDNNTTENALRIIALLRKNRLFLGRTPEAGPRLAVALTVLRSCHLVGVNPMTYLAKVTPKLISLRENLTEWKPGMLAHLLPHTIGLARRERRLGTSSIARAS